ncbi:MAG: hypothetical protein II579_00110 [Treponema sp.]|jgi:Uridine kinase|nr:hypothetical protein [Treponema sp.]MBP5437543.1 hypothetical protein [Treponema sp.]MBP5576405.1 hypothetical protein [Treponema sp.]MBP5747258.1 hypothetical protein [Treponema sp.]MBQ1593035.1 hypothetical protein [Treponema sp.]
MRLEQAIKIVSEQIDALLCTKEKIIVAIDGISASDKSMLAHVLHRIYIPDTTIFRTDDFSLRKEQRDPKRIAKPGYNFDWERFEQQVLIPLSNGKPVIYQRFNFSTEELEPSITVMPAKINIVEGTFCMNENLQKYYDYSVLVRMLPSALEERLRNRSSAKNSIFASRQPLEEIYFEKTDVASKCSLVVDLE